MRMSFRVVAIGAPLLFLAVVVATVLVPKFVWNPPQTVIAEPRTALEERGREVFYTNGCNYCHTQYVRFYDTASGDVSQGGDYVYDNPMILGSERTGPDLSYVGRKRSEAWEIRHWKDPRAMSPLSIMPSFEFLPDQDLQAMAAYLFSLGDRTSAQQMILPPVTYAGMSDPIPFPTATPAPQSQAAGAATFADSQLQAGKELYVSHCMTCHGCAGNGLGTYGGTMTITPADFKQEPFKSMPDDQWFWHVSEGVQGSLMPTWKESLTEDERWQVIRYVQQIFSRPWARNPQIASPPAPYAGQTNPLPKTVETLDQGKHIFSRDCWICHGDSGHGDGIYIAGLQPPPPDFHNPQAYTDWSDAAFFYHISEGVPWTAMPAWKIEYDDSDRWALVYYVQVNFTGREPRPETTSAQVYPAIDLAQTMPVQKTVVEVISGDIGQSTPTTPSLERGRALYLEICANCHGLLAVTPGWDATGLIPPPVFPTGLPAHSLSDGDWFSRITYGIQNTAMPSWGEWIPILQRWDLILYIQQAFVSGLPVNQSVYTGEIALNYITLDQNIWLAQGNQISASDGKTLYGQYCAACHGDAGKGNAPDTVDAPSGGPAAFPAGMTDPYIFWRTAEGVPDSVMYPFKVVLSEADLWNVTAYVNALIGQ
jgi:mono/diheme cytochrome c family protein